MPRRIRRGIVAEGPPLGCRRWKARRSGVAGKGHGDATVPSCPYCRNVNFASPAMPAFPRPHERGIARHRVGTDPKVVLAVPLEDVAVEQRQLVERRQPLAGDILPIDRVCALEPAVLPPGDVVPPRQIVVANRGHHRRLGDRSIEPEGRAAAQLDVVDEGDREPAVDAVRMSSLNASLNRNVTRSRPSRASGVTCMFCSARTTPPNAMHASATTRVILAAIIPSYSTGPSARS